MPLLLLRHAEAGNRGKWEAPDHLRPLSEQGRSQAEAVVGQYREFAVTRVLTSPFVRCVQTVEPLGAALGLPVEETTDLAEGAGPKAALALMRTLAGTTAVLCTHGDVMVDVLDALEEHSGLALPPEYPCAKGGTWVLDGNGLPFTRARYLAPPA